MTAGRVAWPLVLLAILAGCAFGSAASSAGPSSPASPESTGRSGSARSELTVFAAASLKDVFNAMAPVFERAHPTVALVFSFDASSSLRTQIEQGAPADAFASADTQNPETIAAAGLVDGRPVVFAGNRLVVIVPHGNPAGIDSSADLARPGVKIVAAVEAVPIASYAQRAIDLLGRQPGYPADYASAVAANIVSREDNVRAIVTKIELGEGDAGIVYATDAIATPTVGTVVIPDAANVEARYGAVALRSSKHPTEARDFISFLTGSEAQAVFARFGFLSP